MFVVNRIGLIAFMVVMVHLDQVINGFTVKNSNRGIEIDAGAKNVTAENGYLENIRNFADSGHEAFSLDVHRHDKEGGDDNITYKNVYMKNSYAPTTKSSGQLYLVTDLPRNVFYQDITLVNPLSSWVVNGVNVTIKDSKIINSTYNSILLLKNSGNILIDGVEVNPLHNGTWFMLNGLKHTDINNVKVVNSKIILASDRVNDQVFQFNKVGNITLENNTISKNGIISNAKVPEFPGMGMIIFVIATSSIIVTRLFFKQIFKKSLNL